MRLAKFDVIIGGEIGVGDGIDDDERLGGKDERKITRKCKTVDARKN